MTRRNFLFGATASGFLTTGCQSFAKRYCCDEARDKEYVLTNGGRLLIDWPGQRDPLRLWVIGDTHFGLHDERDADYADKYARMARWSAKKEPFEAMLAEARKVKPDLLVLVGDNISFPTLANVEYLKRSLDDCGLSWIYVAGNHDWRFEGEAGSDFALRAKWTASRLKPLYQGRDPLKTSRVVKGVRLVMIDNSLYHVLPEQLEFFEEEVGKGDPVCLFMHIPLWQPGWGVTTCACPDWGASKDPYWQIERRERWSERLLPSTFAFREAVLRTRNLVGVFAGHVHSLQVARHAGQNFFTAPGNADGSYLDVTIRDLT